MTMRVERFQAQDMTQALAMIKARLGPHAVILHSRRIRKGLLRRSVFEVIAAVDEQEPPASPPPAAVAQPPKELLAMREDLAALQEAVTRLTWEVRGARLPAVAPGLQMIYSHLVAQGVSAELASDCVMAAAEELSPNAANDLDTARASVARHLQGKIRTCTPTVGDRPGRVIFLVGPTGVGKTTTLAKLAGRWTREWHRSAVLVSIDTYRAGAMPQLQAYGEVLGVPVEAAYTPEEFAALVRAYGDRDLIFVDTAGRHQQDQAYLDELGTFVAAVDSCEVYLAIAGPTSYADMEGIVRRFEALPLTGMVLTKADETRRLGAAVSLSLQEDLPLAYVTTGQRIPEDVEIASAQDLARWIVYGTREGATDSGDGAHPVSHQASASLPVTETSL
ncbi:MAG: flagellar biosynthesis protein FlhF [Chloroflexi bacterium]|nr:flagellar biosynthesis protein FlhF [Chloroflexota bacterium]